MSIDRIHQNVIFVCDSCDDTLDTETSDFKEANQARIDAGWRTILTGGDLYEHFCLTCKRNGVGS